MVFLNVDRFEILVPTGNEQALSILPQDRRRLQLEKRQMVGGPFAAPSGGMSDVRSLEQDNHSSRYPAAKDNSRKITKVLWVGGVVESLTEHGAPRGIGKQVSMFQGFKATGSRRHPAIVKC